MSYDLSMKKRWCPTCNRNTYHDGNDQCQGHRVRMWAQSSSEEPKAEQCPHCNGTGKIIRHPDTGEVLQ